MIAARRHGGGALAELDDASTRAPAPFTVDQARFLARRVWGSAASALVDIDGLHVVGVRERPFGALEVLGSGPTFEEAFDEALRSEGR